MSKRNEEMLDDLCDAQMEDLLRKVKEGSATAADHNVIRQILKDAGIPLIPNQKAAKSLVDSLPFNDEEPDDKVIRMAR